MAAKVEHRDLLAVVEQVARARIPSQTSPSVPARPPPPAASAPGCALQSSRTGSPAAGETSTPARAEPKLVQTTLARMVGCNSRGLDLPAALQLGEKGGLAVHIGHQGESPAPFQAPVMALHLEMKHLGGESVAMSPDHRQVISVSLMSWASGKGSRSARSGSLLCSPASGATWPDAPQPWDSYMASNRCSETKQRYGGRPAAKPHDDAFITE